MLLHDYSNLEYIIFASSLHALKYIYLDCFFQTGFHGTDCSESSCPVLCNGNGEYVNGVCKCFPGWKGVECSVR